ncbi:DNA alkylation repair protein [Clostridium sp. CM027]|uniref:DNA alkylation repair protein n=1 Tax=Clostridium sp. CM027 TaxID=2849865 RepID=UPI001C6E2F4E|nr:DNA alkylation repair protein [Clostridium sp. CM027]MBW9146145.1 DNA alkylation repair protein [Clostridium sp. CM027]UVE41681.1 DNA alkylation repair protein [Clostridium sp. CM027]
MELNEIVNKIEAFGTPQIKNVLSNHGICEPFFGAKIADLKKLVKFVKKNDDLAKELYKTGIYDAMYLAALSINPKSMSKEELKGWIDKAYCYPIAEYIVATVTAGSDYAVELAKEWITSENEMIAACGWSTYSIYISVAEDNLIDINEIGYLLNKIEANIRNEKNRVKYTMNGFIIDVGTYITELNEKALKVAINIGKVNVLMNKTSCKVPLAKEIIEKMINMDKIGIKRKKYIC